jgi:outer membrane protein OmpA-like peptidoglycan-associated protein
MRRTLVVVVVLAAGGSTARAECPDEPPQQIEARTEPALAESLTTVYFAPGSARIRGAARDEIRNAAEWLADHPERLLVIEGHADTSGSWETNMRMSQDRADAVRDALVEAGADPVRLVSAAHSENEAVYEQAACNRRVVLRGTVQPFEELVESQRAPARERERDRVARPAPRQP